MAGKFELSSERLESIRKAVNEFKESVGNNLKDLSAELKDWRFAVESHEEGVTIDVAMKLLVKPKKK